MTLEREPLKPCPRCGGADVELFIYPWGDVLRTFVACNRCYYGCNFDEMPERETPSEAKEAWNGLPQRAMTQEREPRVEELEPCKRCGNRYPHRCDLRDGGKSCCFVECSTDEPKRVCQRGPRSKTPKQAAEAWNNLQRPESRG